MANESDDIMFTLQAVEQVRPVTGGTGDVSDPDRGFLNGSALKFALIKVRQVTAGFKSRCHTLFRQGE